ncbi:MAG: exosortase/archaeosortase family protein [Desulfobulbaceae bacterium]|jgi:exosortase|nr:exosortase/archaeosortase family protein [Desulfobulbaceae bacterium]
MTPPSTSQRTSLILIGILVAALLLLYWPFLGGLIQDWDENPDYSHGYFIPFIAASMIYSRRDKLVATTAKPMNSGLPLVALGLCLLIVGKVAAEFFAQRLSLLVVLLGLVAFCGGRPFLRLLASPILYLIFMIPLPAIIWNQIAFPMQIFSTTLTEKIIYMLGIPVFREGNVLHLAETTLEVVAACSGLRSLLTMFALAAALAFFSDFSPRRKAALFFSAIPVAVLANIIRLTGTAFLANIYGPQVAEGFLHEFSGLVVFFLGLLMLIGVHNFLAHFRHATE